MNKSTENTTKVPHCYNIMIIDHISINFMWVNHNNSVAFTTKHGWLIHRKNERCRREYRHNQHA